MAFWNKSSGADADAIGADLDHRIDDTQRAVAQARRRLLGAAILLVLACATIPWILDGKPRAWGEDVILRMPKSEQPYQAKPTKPSPVSVPNSAATTDQIKP